MPAFFLIFFASVRNFTVGTDTVNYTADYRYNYDSAYIKINENLEIGFQLLNKTILYFTHEYFYLFLFSSCIVVFSYLYVIRKYSVNYFLSFFIFITFGFYTFYFNGLRQGIAMAIVFLSIPFLINKKIIGFLFICFLGSFFHISALFFIPFFFLIHIKIKLEFKILTCFVFSLLLSRVIVQKLSLSNDRYVHYTQASDTAGGYLTLLFYIFLGLFVYFFGRNIRINSNVFSVFEQIFLCGIALIIPLAFLGTDPSGPQRILYYFSSSVIILLPYVFDRINSFVVTILFVILSLVYYYLITTRFSDLTPFILNDLFRIL
ncbi:EpsG family protein [Acinetobacter guillouiae]|uniref:EpsG family protein n=1 Tax=Acinetobacter guillouiae TaxID=106649 RepID=UPI003AF69238